MATTPPKYFKLDSKGRYVPFAGCTVISFLSDRKEWEAVEHFLRSAPTISSHFAPLPWESYHMTILDLFAQDGRPLEEVKAQVEKETANLQALQQDLITRSSQLVFRPKIVRLFRESTIGLELELDVKETAEAVQAIRFSGQTTFRLPARTTPYRFHMTLAYNSFPIWVAQIDTLDKEIAELNRLIRSLTTRSSSSTARTAAEQDEEGGGRLQLEAPRVCWFDDMTKFTPLSYVHSTVSD